MDDRPDLIILERPKIGFIHSNPDGLFAVNLVVSPKPRAMAGSTRGSLDITLPLDVEAESVLRRLSVLYCEKILYASPQRGALDL